VASSVLLFVQTMIGYGLGPLLSGFVSDQLAPAYGTESLRYALASIGVVNVWAALHYALGTRTLTADLAHVEEECSEGRVAVSAVFASS
jgi:hypothetical protein